ncbi:MAG: HAMP domain-containing histidine kinase [Candidatus Thermoplasmatota archaeon]|nr:HAMP domain-containing histidine kinase [Candidatus Thermoplasmatota archaeon]
MDSGETSSGRGYKERPEKEIMEHEISDDLAKKILEISMAVLHHRDEMEILVIIGKAATELFPIKKLVIYRTDPHTGAWMVRHLVGYDEDQARQIKEVTYTAESWKDTLKISDKIGALTYFAPGEYVLIEDFDSSFYDGVPRNLPPRKDPDEWHPMDFTDTILFDKDGKQQGCIEIMETTNHRKPSRNVIAQLEILASVASIAIELSHMWVSQESTLDASAKRARVFSGLLNLATRIVVAMDRSEMLVAARDFLSSHLKFMNCQVALRDEREGVFRFVNGDSSEDAGTILAKTVHIDCDPAYRFTEDLFWTPTMQFTEHRLSQMPIRPIDSRMIMTIQESSRATGKEGDSRYDLFVIPLRDHSNHVVAVIYAMDRPDDGMFEKDLLEMMSVYGSIVSLAFRNNDLIEEIVSSNQDIEMLNRLLFHDISSYNTGIGVLIDLATRKDVQDEERNLALDKAKKQIMLSNDLISRIKQLVFVKEKGTEKMLTIDLVPILHGLAKDFKESSTEKTVSIDIDAPDNRCLIRGNDLLHDLFQNLLNNSIKYDPREHVKIDISIMRHEEEGRNWCVISIADHGVGVPDDKKLAIFGKFAPRVSGGKGIGLGLSIVKSITEQFGGRIWVEDREKGNPRAGAIFNVMLPVVD